MKQRGHYRLKEIFLIPALIFIVTLAGLVSALLTDNSADLFGAVASGSALLVVLWVLAKPFRVSRK